MQHRAPDLGRGRGLAADEQAGGRGTAGRASPTNSRACHDRTERPAATTAARARPAAAGLRQRARRRRRPAGGGGRAAHAGRGARAQVPTGIAIALPEGFEAQVRPRSGLAARHGVTVLNSPGTVDDYRGEIAVILINLGEAPFRVERGMRIAQLVVAPVAKVAWRETAALPETERAPTAASARRAAAPAGFGRSWEPMLRLSRKTLFAIEAVLDIAYRGRPAGAEPRDHPPAGHSSPLSRASAAEPGAQRRAARRARAAWRLSAGARAAPDHRRRDHPRRSATPAANGDPLVEERLAARPKVVRPLWLEMQGQLSRLDEAMDDLCNRADLAGIVSEGRSNLDFSI